MGLPASAVAERAGVGIDALMAPEGNAARAAVLHARAGVAARDQAGARTRPSSSRS